MPDNVLEFTSMIVSSFLGKNQTSGADLPALIRTVHGALTNAAAPLPEPEPPQAPAVTARRSITPDALVCMECGKSFKSLKRHLRTDHGLSPEGYRSKWSLPKTYPMVAPTYSAARSALAKSTGTGLPGKDIGWRDGNRRRLGCAPRRRRAAGYGIEGARRRRGAAKGILRKTQTGTARQTVGRQVKGSQHQQRP